jgi:hypothetical protein
MHRELLIPRIGYPSLFPFSYHPIPLGGSAVLLLRILKVYSKLLMLQIRYRLHR